MTPQELWAFMEKTLHGPEDLKLERIIQCARSLPALLTIWEFSEALFQEGPEFDEHRTIRLGALAVEALKVLREQPTPK